METKFKSDLSSLQTKLDQSEAEKKSANQKSADLEARVEQLIQNHAENPGKLFCTNYSDNFQS